MIEVYSLGKKFQDVAALKNISFVCPEGESFGLLGLNGAGKTTCLRILSTILKPTTGEAKICGYDIEKNPQQVRRHIGVLSAEANLYPRFTPQEIVKFSLQSHNIDLQIYQERLKQLADELNMQDYLDRRIETFSTGMKHKVELVLAFIHQPPVLLLDEPTAGLDITSAKLVREFIKEYKKKKHAIVICSHHLQEIEELCDQIAIIHQGEIAEIGTLNQLKTKWQESSLEEIFIKVIQSYENKVN